MKYDILTHAYIAQFSNQVKPIYPKHLLFMVKTLKILSSTF